MAARLPAPGSDDGTWGDILNSFLEVAHNADGTLQNSAVTAAGAYTKPAGGVPGSDIANATITDANISATAAITRTKLNTSAQTSLGKADSAVQSVNSKTPTTGNVNIGVTDLTDVLGAAGATDSQVLTYSGSASKWVPATVSSTTVSDATTTNKGIVELAGDLAGTATTPQVTSTHLASALPVNQGGTGSTTQNFVDLATAQTVGGNKTLSGTTTTNNLVATNLQVTGGTPATGKVLTSDTSGNATWQTPPAGFTDPTTTKGDLIVHGASTTRLGVGTNGQVLTADSAQTNGVAWATPASAPVSSVAGKTGAVTLNESDITNLATDLAAKVPTSRQVTAGTGLSGGGDLSADRSLSVVGDSTTQRIEVAHDGTLAATRKRVNFIEGSNVTITTTDDSTNNKVDITIAATTSTASSGIPGAPGAAYISGAKDALTAQMLSDLGKFTGWLLTNNAQGFIGEFGWADNPTSSDGYRWGAGAEYWFQAIDQAGLWATHWGEGSAWGTGYKLSAYYSSTGSSGSVDTALSGATVIERHPTTVGYMRGVNSSGGEFASESYDPQGSFTYYASRGIKLIRLPVSWERLQPTLGQPLNSTELSNLTTIISRASTAGLKVIVDVHNFARYTSGSNTYIIGDSNLPISDFADLWSRLSTAFSGNSTVIAYGLMNEPYGMPGGATTWESASQAAVNAIRANNDSKLIMVGGYNYSGVTQFVVYHPTAWITDTYNNIRYEAHHYWDGGTGSYSTSYDTNLANARTAGFADSLGDGTLDVKLYGVVADGSTDDSTAFGAAVTAAGAMTTPPVVQFTGNVKLNSSITPISGVSIKGKGAANSVLLPYSTSAAISGVFSSGSPLTDCTMADFKIDGSHQSGTYASSIKGIFVQYAKRCMFKNLYIYNTYATGLGIDFLVDTVIDSVVADTCGRGNSGAQPGGSGIGIGTGQYTIEDFSITNCVAINNKRYGIFIETQTTTLSRGMRIANCYAAANTKGYSDAGGDGAVWSNNIAYNNATGFTNDYGTISARTGINTLWESCIAVANTSNGFVYNPSGSVAGAGVGRVTWKNCKAYLNTVHGFYWLSDASSPLASLAADNCDSYLNGQEGLRVEATGATVTDISVIGGRYYNNSTTTTNTHSGIKVVTATTRLRIMHAACFDNQGTQTQQYGIHITTGTQTNPLIQGCDLRNNTSGALTNAGTISTGIIRNNAGYNPVGTASVTATASPMTYTAGPTPEILYVSGGTVSSITKGGNALGTTAGPVQLAPNEATVITYSSAPTLLTDKQ